MFRDRRGIDSKVKLKPGLYKLLGKGFPWGALQNRKQVGVLVIVGVFVGVTVAVFVIEGVIVGVQEVVSPQGGVEVRVGVAVGVGVMVPTPQPQVGVMVAVAVGDAVAVAVGPPKRVMAAPFRGMPVNPTGPELSIPVMSVLMETPVW